MTDVVIRNLQKSPSWIVLVIGVLVSLIPVFLPGYSAAWVLFWMLAVLSLPWTLTRSFTMRLTVFFCLLASADFAKRLVFLLDDQAGFSQYVIYLFPYLYYFIVLLLPWGLSHLRHGLPRYQIWVWALIIVMLFNTWLSGSTSIIAKAAATALLILPWTIILIAAEHPESIISVGRALVVIGILNALYAAFHRVFGPSAIELRWMQSTSEFSIGASHLEAFVSQRYGGVNVWRPIGLQADSFTLALFCLNVYAMAWMLRVQRRMSARIFYFVSVFLLGGIMLSLVRTVWVAALAMIAFFFLARRFAFLARPPIVMVLMLAMFFVADIASSMLYSFMWLAGVIKMPILARVLTTGTLEARAGSINAFVESLPRFLFHGYGLAASSWITSKFGGFADLPLNFGKHNVVIEYLWYVGAPGLILLFAIPFFALQSVWKACSESGKVHSDLPALAAAYVIAMYLTGLGNGGAFLAPNFFYLMGILFSAKYHSRSAA